MLSRDASHSQPAMAPAVTAKRSRREETHREGFDATPDHSSRKRSFLHEANFIPALSEAAIDFGNRLRASNIVQAETISPTSKLRTRPPFRSVPSSELLLGGRADPPGRVPSVGPVRAIGAVGAICTVGTIRAASGERRFGGAAQHRLLLEGSEARGVVGDKPRRLRESGQDVCGTKNHGHACDFHGFHRLLPQHTQ